MTIFKTKGGAWAALHKGMVDFTGGEMLGAVVQPMAIAERASWDTDNKYLNAYRELRIANQSPTWNPLYIPATGVSVPDEYQAFLDRLNSNIIEGSGVADPQRLKKLNDERWDAQNQLQKNEYFINKQWERYVANHAGKPPMSKKRWEVEFGFSATRQSLKSRVQVALAAYMREVSDAGGELLEIGRAFSALSDPRQQISLPQDELDSELGPDNWQQWYRAGLDDNINEFLSDEYSFSMGISNTSAKTSKFEDKWSASASLSWFGVFGASAGVSNQTIQHKSETDTSGIKMSFKNIQSFPIYRGKWFKGGLVSQFRDRMPPNFWGPGGRLSLIPTAVILVRGTKIEMDTSKEVTDYYFNKREVGGRAGVRIGPFSFGGGGSRTTTHENSSFQRTENGLIIEDKSDRAQVLAVVSIRQSDLLSKGSDQFDSLAASMPAEGIEEGLRQIDFARQEVEETN